MNRPPLLKLLDPPLEPPLEHVKYPLLHVQVHVHVLWAFDKLGRHAMRGGSQKVLICGLVRSRLSILFWVCIVWFQVKIFYTIRGKFLLQIHLKLYTLIGSIFSKAVVCLGEKQCTMHYGQWAHLHQCFRLFKAFYNLLHCTIRSIKKFRC